MKQNKLNERLNFSIFKVAIPSNSSLVPCPIHANLKELGQPCSVIIENKWNLECQAVIYLSFLKSCTKTRFKNEWQIISYETIRLEEELLIVRIRSRYEVLRVGSKS